MPYADPEKRRKYQKQYQRTYYLRNRDETIKRSVANKRQRRSEKKDWLLNELGGVCVRCGYDNPAGLDVHHTDPTYKNWGTVRPGRTVVRESFVRRASPITLGRISRLRSTPWNCSAPTAIVSTTPRNTTIPIDAPHRKL